jgi:hypothetical protein
MPSFPLVKLKQVLRPESQGPSSLALHTLSGNDYNDLKTAELGPRKSLLAFSPQCRVRAMGSVGELDGGLFLLLPGFEIGELGLDDEGGTG